MVYRKKLVLGFRVKLLRCWTIMWSKGAGEHRKAIKDGRKVLWKVIKLTSIFTQAAPQNMEEPPKSIAKGQLLFPPHSQGRRKDKPTFPMDLFILLRWRASSAIDVILIFLVLEAQGLCCSSGCCRSWGWWLLLLCPVEADADKPCCFDPCGWQQLWRFEIMLRTNFVKLAESRVAFTGK